MPVSRNLPAGMYSGAVLQVVQGTYATAVSTTSSSFVTTNLSASITPTSSSSKILILFNAVVGGNASDSVYLTIYRGASNLGTGTGTPNNSFLRVYTGSNAAGSMQPISYLDSPATTSSTTYTAYFCGDGIGTVWFNRISANANSVQPSFITLLEIAA